jgi:hypothetical protein
VWLIFLSLCGRYAAMLAARIRRPPRAARRAMSKAW